MKDLSDKSVDLVVTSPPYPMIEMWDEIFKDQSPKMAALKKKGDAQAMFEAMHDILDRIWEECFRVLKPGGFACINIGDATRTIREHFCLYPNHARILSFALNLGFTPLPCIIWRKQTNAPNKFMGSGMLPAGAYVTLEHEYILILRKGGKRLFRKEEDKLLRHESALFWEERNNWFSDIWFDLKGTVQKLKDKADRKRSGAFPFELAYRLINMYSLKNDLVLDPFLGTGTTMAAAMAAGRNSLGFERDKSLGPAVRKTAEGIISLASEVIESRLAAHLAFVDRRREEKGPLKHINTPYGFAVMTSQEKKLLINSPAAIESLRDGSFKLEYDPAPQKDFCRDPAGLRHDPSSPMVKADAKGKSKNKPEDKPGNKFEQGTLF